MKFSTLITAPYLHILATGLVMAVVLALAWLVFTRFWKQPSRARNACLNVFTVCMSLSVFYLVAEILFAYVFLATENVGVTLSCQRWFYLYWKPINSYGYRDREPDWSKPSLFVVGDSFTAAQGVRNIDDRFSGLLAQQLGKHWNVVTVAREGWSAADYLDALKRMDHVPQKIIIAYFVNDIEHAAGLHHQAIYRYPSVDGVSDWEKAVASNSYFANWVFWKFLAGKRWFVGPDSIENNSVKTTLAAYNDTAIWQSHREELDGIMAYARQAHAEIYFVFWPHIRDIPDSELIIGKVKGYVESQGARTLDLSEVLSRENPDTLMISAYDAHPTEKAHRLAADAILATFTDLH